jgi:hypothetical protein
LRERLDVEENGDQRGDGPDKSGGLGESGANSTATHAKLEMYNANIKNATVIEEIESVVRAGEFLEDPGLC